MKTRIGKILMVFVIFLFWQNVFAQEIKKDENIDEKEFLTCVERQFKVNHPPQFLKNRVYIFGQVEIITSIQPNDALLKPILTKGEKFISLTEAIAVVGGLKKDADKKIVILREDENLDKKIIIDLKKIMAGKSPDVELKLNDLVFVPMSCKKFKEETESIQEKSKKVLKKFRLMDVPKKTPKTFT